MAAETIAQSFPSESEGRIGWLGVFAAPALEKSYRRRHFRDDLWLSRFLVIAGALRVALFFLADYQLFGLSDVLWPLLASRVLFLMISAGVLFALPRAASPAAADRLFFSWCVLLGIMTVFSLSNRPPSHTNLLLMSFGTVLVVYCVTPLPLSRQALLALGFSAAALYVSRRADSATLSAVATVYVMCNLFGAIMSWRLNYRRRQTFLGNLRAAHLQASLKEAVAEIRTLRGLLCICAWCKRIRDEKEAWQTVETYVEKRTEASFTHGICPDCLQSQTEKFADVYR